MSNSSTNPNNPAEPQQPSQSPTNPPHTSPAQFTKPTKLYAAIGILTVSLLASLATTTYLLLNQPSQVAQTTKTPAPETQLTDSQDQPSQQDNESTESEISTDDWQEFQGNGYAFKYPQGLKSDTGASGQGVESIRVSFMGPKQVASGRTQSMLADGYQFVVTKIESNTTKSAQQQAQEERTNSEENCNFDQVTISSITQTEISGITAAQYSVTECYGDYTSSYLVHNDSLYRITQVYTGEDPEKQDYKSITDQILSTFEFVNKSSQIPDSWSLQANADCNIQVPLPPKAPPYYTPDQNTPQPVGGLAGSFWQFRDAGSSEFIFNKNITAIYAHPEAANGVIPGAVDIHCTNNTQSLSSQQLVDQIERNLAVDNPVSEQFEEAQIKLGNPQPLTKWGFPVVKANISGGFYGDRDYYFLATPSNLYMISTKVDADDQLVRDTTQQIFDNLQFTN